MKSNSFIERSLKDIQAALGTGQEAEELAAGPGWLQSIDARVKSFGLLALLGVGLDSKRWEIPGCLFLLATIFALGSRIPVRHLFFRQWLPVGIFTAFVALPSLFLVPGPPLVNLGGLAITATGAQSAGLLLLRTEMSTALALLLPLTTPWPKLLRAWRAMGVPPVVTMLVAMTQRYLFLMLEIAGEMFIARRARMVGNTSRGAARQISTASAGVLLDRGMALSEEVSLAMQARGFRGDFPALKEQPMKWSDGLAAIEFASVTVLAFVWGQV